MKLPWYSFLPIAVYVVSIISYFTVLYDLWPLEFCFSNECWGNLLDYFSFTFQSLAAAIVLTTLSFSAFRIKQTQSQLENQSNQIQSQQSQIDNTIYHQFRSEFNDFFAYIDENPSLHFKSVAFRFKDKLNRVFPNAKHGDTKIAMDINYWLECEVFQELSALIDGIQPSKLEAYKISSYSDVFKNTFYRYQELFFLEFHIDNEIYDGSLISNHPALRHASLLSDINPVTSLQRGRELHRLFEDIYLVASKLDEFIGNKYFTIEQLKKLKNDISFFGGLVDYSMQWHGKYESNVDVLKRYSPEFIDQSMLSMFDSTKGAEREIVKYKLTFDERMKHLSKKLLEHLH